MSQLCQDYEHHKLERITFGGASGPELDTMLYANNRYLIFQA